MNGEASDAAADLLRFADGRKFATILADPPWRFANRTGKMAPEHRRLARYGTLTLGEIASLPVAEIAAEPAHLYLWVPNALLPEGLRVMEAWGFRYKSNIVWHKVRKDGGSDGRGVGFYFRNVTELVLFGVRGKDARTLAAGRRQVNLLATRKREHSRKPDELYPIIEACSPGTARRVVRTWRPQGLDHVGRPGRPELQAQLVHLSTQFQHGSRRPLRLSFHRSLTSRPQASPVEAARPLCDQPRRADGGRWR